MLDTGYDGIDEDTARPGEAVAQSANKGQKCGRRRGLECRGRDQNILTFGEVILLEHYNCASVAIVTNILFWWFPDSSF